MFINRIFIRYCLLLIIPALFSCSGPTQWPDSPLYDHAGLETVKAASYTKAEMIQKLIGHYAHYDVVAYEDNTTKTPMKNFTISYGFSDFYVENNKLYQKDTFLTAKQLLNQNNVLVSISDKAVQSIKPRIQEVSIKMTNGEWLIYRPPTPTLLGIKGDPLLPLSTDPEDPNLTDPDEDGHPGVTVRMKIAGFIKAEIYLIRREIFSDFLSLYTDGSLRGYVKDDSEQLIISASMKALLQDSNAFQYKDNGLNPILLIPINENIDTLEELLEIKDEIFPEEPAFKK